MSPHRLASCSTLVVLFLCGDLIAQQPPVAASPVIVAPVVRRELSSGQTLVGTVTPVRRSSVGSAVDARVETFHVEAGDAVKKGQPLVRLLSGTLEIELRAAQAELATRDAELAELKNGARSEEIEQSKNLLAAAAAVLKSRKSRFDRAKSLLRSQAITDELFDDALSAFDEAQANYAASQAKHALMVNGARPEQIARAEAMKMYQAEQVKLIEDRILKHVIRSPFDGFVSMENTEVGQWVSRGDVVVEVVELAVVDIEVFLMEKYLANLQLGTKVRVEVPALPGQVFDGVVHSVVPQADTRSRSFPVHVRVKNNSSKAGPVLKAGMMARVPMPVGERRLATLVPKDALVLGGRQPVIFVVRKSSKGDSVQRVPVELGVMDDDLIEVPGDSVKASELVVIRGNERLKDGELVAATLATVPKASESTPTSSPNRTSDSGKLPGLRK